MAAALPLPDCSFGFNKYSPQRRKGTQRKANQLEVEKNKDVDGRATAMYQLDAVNRNPPLFDMIRFVFSAFLCAFAVKVSKYSETGAIT